MNLNLKQKILASNLSIIGVLLIITATIIYPTTKSILSLRQDIGSIQTQLEERYEKTQKLKRSLKELSEVKVLTAQLEKAFVKPGEELSLITTFEQIASQNQIDQTLNLADVNEQKQHYYRLSFLNNGSLANHLAYLVAVEQLPYYVIIKNLNFEKRQLGQNNANGPVTLRFDAIIYVETN